MKLKSPSSTLRERTTSVCNDDWDIDIDKVKETKFTPIITDDYITFKEAKETIVLKKIYIQQMDKNKFNDDILKCYPDGAEAHYIIIGEVINYIK